MLIRRAGKHFAAVSTGNFNENTATAYVDTTLLTGDPRIADEVSVVFEYLEDASRNRVDKSPAFQHLLVSPFNLRQSMVRMLEEEAEKGTEGYVLLKVNHLCDAKLIGKIRSAADAGVRVDAIVRTACTLPPHPNIRAISIVDRFLEHQRVYIFGKGPRQRVFLGSADGMERNLDWRVEVMCPILDESLAREMVRMMTLQLEDDCKARYHDAAASNTYVGGGIGVHRAQLETHQFLASKSGTHSSQSSGIEK